ncbi:MAG: hypothetical protein HN644_13170 [Rhodospirillales bacterium]|jgi:hypothetical protein|nr:hypothetical protein [Rhodospirillales bacterium]MBT4039505.1 hypothetical protein [Rhodospirillales bacterium]MBT4626747.1 hypothetical protein [Rhodospirillales bacterium]MBT5520264.1 hypothetical protein [Rhodospirillales bacterium]MBT6108682.1 hypothetical protein [Rhodospirillales bacterium]
MKSPQEIEELIESARGWYARGLMCPAELCVREVFDSNPNHADAFHILGEICLKLGLPEQAATAFEKVLEFDAGSESAQENFQIAQERPAPTAFTTPHYLLIKSWGHGFWSDVTHTLACLLISEITGRIPIVHWGRNSAFDDGSDNNAFHLYFDPVSDLTIDDLAGIETLTIYPDKWSKENLREEDLEIWEGKGARLGGILYLNRAETLVVSDFNMSIAELLPWIPESHPMHGQLHDDIGRYLAEKYLSPVVAIRDEVRSFFDTHLAGRSPLAVHIRGLDKQFEVSDLDDKNNAILKALDKKHPEGPIFLLTDDEGWLAKFRDQYGDRVVTTDCERTTGHVGVHNLPLDEGARLGREMMLDTYIALACDKFIGNGLSNVSSMISLLKQWPGDSCELVSRTYFRGLAYGIHIVVEPKLQAHKVFSGNAGSYPDGIIHALERIDASSSPVPDFIDYRDSIDLNRAFQRVADSLNGKRCFEAMMRLQTVNALFIGRPPQQLPTTIQYLNMLIFLAELRRQSGDQHIVLDQMVFVLNSLSRQDQDREMRLKVNALTVAYNEGHMAACENGISACLENYLPEIAAPMAKDARDVLIAMSQEFENQRSYGLLGEIDLAVDQQPRENVTP